MGPGRWLAKCPAHQDKHPSMNVKELPDGKVLVICRSGCTNEEIVNALGLHWTALFPEPDNTYAEFKRERRRIPAADVLEALSSEALVVAVAAQNIASGVELTAGDLERLMTASRRIMAAREMTHA